MCFFGTGTAKESEQITQTSATFDAVDEGEVLDEFLACKDGDDDDGRQA